MDQVSGTSETTTKFAVLQFLSLSTAAASGELVCLFALSLRYFVLSGENRVGNIKNYRESIGYLDIQ